MSLYSRQGDVDGEGWALVEGAFYWVLPAYCPDFDLFGEWNNEKQPARYDGLGRWDSIGTAVETDISEKWPIIQIGKRIHPPE